MPKGPRKFDFAFEKSGLTRFGGLSLFQSFCRGFAIRRFRQKFVRWPDYDYRDYHPADLFLAHVFCVVVGLGRIENTQCLIHNGLIPPLHARSSTILTSNRGVDEWMAVFDEPLLGQSALDRFCHRAHQFVIEGESYRKRTAPGSASAPKTGRPATT